LFSKKPPDVCLAAFLLAGSLEILFDANRSPVLLSFFLQSLRFRARRSPVT
jgi:hypothetical protein